MGTYIVLAILAVVILYALRGTLGHLKGQGGCCGGGGSGEVLAEKKDIKGPVLFTARAKIGGMHCENCQNRVQNRLNKIDGLVAKVNYRDGSALLSYEKEVSEEMIRQTVKDAGYELISLEKNA